MKVRDCYIYLADENGTKKKISFIPEAEIEIEATTDISIKDPQIVRNFMNWPEKYRLTAIGYIPYRLKLSLLYGFKVTNNWLKMHGGIMGRNGGRRKKRRRL